MSDESNSDDDPPADNRSAGGDDGESDGYGDLEVAEPPTYDAPPELIVGEGGHYGAVVPNGTRLTTWYGSEWRCDRCDTLNTSPQDPGPGNPEPPDECQGCERQGPFSPAVSTPDDVADSEILDLFTTKKLYEPPKADFDFEETPTFESVYGEIREYIKQYWAAGDGREWLYDMLAAYVISTWFREQWHFVPHLLVIGRHETGKSRLLNTLSNISYRCVHNASLTSAYLYRAVNEHHCTMFVSEYHRLGDEKQEDVDAVVNAGQKRGETIGRCAESTAGGIDPETFDPFTHIAISTQYEPDDDTISRCFEITTKPAQRDIPRRLADRPDLRQKLLYLRLRYLRSDELGTAEQDAIDVMDDLGVRNRLSEKMWCILTVGALANQDMSPVVEAAVDHEEERQRDTEESIFAQALLDEAFEQLADDDEKPGEKWGGLLLPISSVKDRFDRLSDRDVSSSYIGQLRNRVGIGKVRHSDGTKIKDANLKPKLKQLASENGVEFGTSPGVVETVHSVEIATNRKPHSLEEENDQPTQEERKDTLLTVCEFLSSEEPTDVEKAAEVAASKSKADQQTFENELELMLRRNSQFERLDDGDKFNYLG